MERRLKWDYNLVMTQRLGIIEEQQIDYEIPYITRRGEIIENTAVQINEKIEDLNISYALMSPSEQKLEKLFPSDGISFLARMVKQIIQVLEINAKEIILQLWEYSPVNGLYSVEGRAPVNKQRDTVMIILTKTPFVYKYGYELVLWHQAMHAKDRFEYRFPCAHPLVEVGDWLDILWHFSVDGRLQNMGRPHYSREERLDEAGRLLKGLCRIDNLPERLQGICYDLWGRGVTFSQLVETGKKLGLSVPSWHQISNFAK